MESESNRQLYLWHEHMSLEDDLYDQRIQRISEIEALGFHALRPPFRFHAYDSADPGRIRRQKRRTTRTRAYRSASPGAL